MRVVSLGNFTHGHCTEVYTARALRENGCEVVEVQQDHAFRMGPDLFVSMLLTGALSKPRPDLVLYTRTHNRTALGPAWTDAWQRLGKAGIVTASYHLDRFFDLQRERLVWDADPLFTVDHCFTADGGNQDRFAAAHVNHHWLPPGVDRQEAAETPGVPDPRKYGTYRIAFIGSTEWYHDEYPQRMALIQHLRLRYGHRQVAFIGNGRRTTFPVVRQQALNDALASIPIVVGDSCFANDPPATSRATDYWSDRIPETIGRGGFLLHPASPGLIDYHGTAVATYEPGDWDSLDAAVKAAVEWPEGRQAQVELGRQQILAKHTMTHRMGELLDVCGLSERLPDPDANGLVSGA